MYDKKTNVENKNDIGLKTMYNFSVVVLKFEKSIGKL